MKCLMKNGLVCDRLTQFVSIDLWAVKVCSLISHMLLDSICALELF